MKKIFLLSIIIGGVLEVSLAQVKMPSSSPTQVVKQEFGIGSIEITYSRPAAKGRKIYGDLVPYGKIWRTGANAATLIKFSDAVELMGKKIDTGTYALYTIPGQDYWEIILNKGISNWGAFEYKETDDVLRFKAEPQKMKTKLESFTIQFANVMPQNCDLQLMWEKTIVTIPVTVTIKDKLKAQIEAALKTDKKPYWQAAQFYYEYEKNTTKAIEYCSKAIEGNAKAYWIYLYKAKIQHEVGDLAGAKASSLKSKELAELENDADYVKMNDDLLKKLK